MARAGEPGEDGLRSGETAWLPGPNAELDERDEPPLGTAPFRVDVGAESAVRLLACEQRVYLRTFENAGRLGRRLLVEQVALCLRDDPRLVRLEQPVDGGDRDAHLTLLRRSSTVSTARIHRAGACQPHPGARKPRLIA